MKIKILELFGGIGAPRKALERVVGKDNIKSIDYVEILDYACLAYDLMYKDLRKPQSVTDWNLNVDILIHGSPCQDFSSAGKNLGGEKGSGTRSGLLWETIDIIEHRLNVKPKVVIWENVKGVLTKKHNHVFNEYLNELERLGYVNQYKVLNGIDFGIPQRRERVFTVSLLKGQDKFNNEFSFDNLETKPLRPLKSFLTPHHKVPESYFIKQSSMIKSIQSGKIKLITDNTFTITTKQMRWNNAGVLKIPLTSFNAENYIVSEDSTIQTITASGANSRIKIAIPKISNDLPVFKIEDQYYNLRILTEQECWLLMGFDLEDYNKVCKHIGKTGMYHLAGNSIIVNILESIFKELIKENK